MYPTTLYHRSELPKVVTDHDEHRRMLGDGWADTPAAFYPDAPPVVVAETPEVPSTPPSDPPASAPRRELAPRKPRKPKKQTEAPPDE